MRYALPEASGKVALTCADLRSRGVILPGAGRAGARLHASLPAPERPLRKPRWERGGVGNCVFFPHVPSLGLTGSTWVVLGLPGPGKSAKRFDVIGKPDTLLFSHGTPACYSVLVY